jgi:hypothetical protein
LGLFEAAFFDIYLQHVIRALNKENESYPIFYK